MTIAEFFDNACKGMTAKEEGFSVKKMIAVVSVTVMLLLTLWEVDKDNFLMVLTAWISFVTGLLITGAVEKNITSVNETKQKAIVSPPEPEL